MKVTQQVKDLTTEELAAQSLVFTLIPANNLTRATRKPEEGEKKPKGRRKRT